MDGTQTHLSQTHARNELISTSDVASLAGVKRSVVSVWKKRKLRTEYPFPTVQTRVGQTDYFSVEDISTWFENTKMGNNPRAAQDAFSYSALELMGNTQVLQPLIEALLVLRAQCGIPLVPNQEFLISAADDVDPDDEFLFSEAHRATAMDPVDDSLPELETILGFVNYMYDNAFSTGNTLKVLQHRERNQNLAARARFMNPLLADFIADFMAAVAGREGRFGTPLTHIDLVSHHFDVIQRVFEENDFHAEFGSSANTYPFFASADDTAKDRQTLRRLVALGRPYMVLESTESYTATDSLFTAFIPPNSSAEFVEQILEDRLLAIVDGSHWFAGVVVGPKDLLAGADRDVERVRTELIRQGTLRVVALLPQGLYPNHGKEQLALWVLERPVDRPNPAAPVFVGDLLGVPKEEGLQRLLTDVLSALDMSKSRAYAYLFTKSISTISAERTISFQASAHSTGSGTTALQPGPHHDPASDAVTLQQALRTLNETDLVTDFEVTARPSSSKNSRSHRPLISLTQAREQRLIAVKQGYRIDPDWTKPAVPGDTSARVLDKPLLLSLVTNPSKLPHQLGSRAIDALTLGQLDSVELTKPGDVVFFQHKGSKAVWVDPDGGHVVSYPLRVVRPRSGRVLSGVLARDMSGYQVHASAWSKWQVHVLPDSYVGGVGSVLADVERSRRELLARLHALDEFEQVLGDVVSRGGVRVEPRL